MRKSRILTFLFALWPGAGQMYLGYMKRGVSLMGVFCLLIAITGFLNLGILFFLLPVIWFYAFFDTLNLRSMSYEFLPQDDFLFHPGTVGDARQLPQYPGHGHIDFVALQGIPDILVRHLMKPDTHMGIGLPEGSDNLWQFHPAPAGSNTDAENAFILP